ncbi:MAG: MarR family transcriptional regulator [Flavobacteriales bacterium]|nr:MarR family transcriptional regulator [Flavobacteriales bacterium]
MQTVQSMRLEEEIKQGKGFQSQRHKAVVNIMFTDGWVRGLLTEVLKPYGLTNQQYNVLRILRGSSPEPLSTSSIRERMLDKMSDASRIVDRLYKKRLVDRKTCKADKRLVDIFITKEGLNTLEKIDSAMNSFHLNLDAITEEEAETLNSLLDKLRG